MQVWIAEMIGPGDDADELLGVGGSLSTGQLICDEHARRFGHTFMAPPNRIAMSEWRRTRFLEDVDDPDEQSYRCWYADVVITTSGRDWRLSYRITMQDVRA